ncbi:MAG: hypothetical protein AABW67_00875 [Nanoarchaeota archaeon]
MNKQLVLPIFVLLIISSLMIVSATTLINGKIYNSDFSQTVSGASVIITCNGTDTSYTSLGDGSYAVTYDEAICADGNTLTVSASHPSYGIGSQTGVINPDMVPDMVMTWDIGIVNVPLIPEFGVFVGALTILSAVGIFFFVRRD